MLLQIAAFRFDIDSQKISFWNALAPKTHVLCVGLMVLAIALTPNGHWWTWGVYALATFCWMVLSKITWPVLLKRVAIEFSFIGTVLLGTLFQRGGEVLWQWGWLQVTETGLVVLGSVASKAILCLLLLNLLTLTTSVPALLQALVQLRVPPLLVAILASMYRYIGVLIDEFSAMRQAATSRNLMVSSRRRQRGILGNVFGSLFIRTLDRGDRIHQAMVARGYTGLPRHRNPVQASWRDGVAISAIALISLLGQALYLPQFLLNF